MNDIFILANPSSGKNEAEEAAHYLKTLYGAKDMTAEIHLTTEEEDIYHFSKDASDRSFESIIAIGGDGTVSELMNAIKGFDYKPKIGLIPTGTVNNISNSLGISQNIDEACEQIVNGIPSISDVGQVNGDLFISSLSAGSVPEQSWKVSSEDKEEYGKMAYVWNGLQSLTDQDTYKFDIELDGEKKELDLDMLLIGVSHSIAGISGFFNQATYDDGYLHMYGIKKSNLSEKVTEFSRLLTSAEISQDSDNKSFLIPFKEARIKLLNKNKHVAVDGEKGPEFPLDIKVIPGYVTFIVPHEENKD